MATAKTLLPLPKFRILSSTDYDRIAKWDGEIFGGNREPLLRALNEENPNRTLILEDEAGNLIGFLLAQTAVMGPAAADTPQAAADLLQHALTLDYEHAPRVILPDAHQGGESLLAASGFTPIRTSRYFIRGQAPTQQRNKMYGQGAYSLG